MVYPDRTRRAVDSPSDRASFERLSAALGERGCRFRPRGADHLDGQCPAHEDGRASLSADWHPPAGELPGRVMVRCHAGCAAEDVVAALGLVLADLYDGPAPRRSASSPRRGSSGSARKPAAKPAINPAAKPADHRCRWERVAGYLYCDETGAVVGEVIRQRCGKCGAKNFPVRRPAVAGDDPARVRDGWVFQWPKVRPLYRLPEVLAAARAGGRVFVVEGEKDADALAEAGEVATCNPGGADNGRGGKWRREHTAALAGAVVVIVADRDAAGYGHAEFVRGELAAAGAVRAVRVVEAAIGKDPADHLAAGRVPAEFVVIDPAAKLAALAEPADDGDQGAAVLPGPWTGGKGGGSGGSGGGSADDVGEFPVPGSLGFRYTPGVGVWSGRQMVLPWCPVATAHLGAYSARGKVTRRWLTVEVGGTAATARMPEIEDGSVWERFPDAPGTARRDVREVLANLLADQAARLPLQPLHPRWEDGRLRLPPDEALPRGYGVLAGTAEEWRALLREVARSPLMALAVGLAVGGLYVQPLRRQSYMVHLPGASSEGKTTTMTAAAAMFGDPAAVVLPWSVTKQGPGSWLRSMVLLTGFRDELGAGNLTGKQLESLVFGLLEGAERDMSSKTGDYRPPEGSWHGALISTGNESIVGQLANEGIPARVLEIAGPFTLDAEHADRVSELAGRVHGHGLVALAERGPAPGEFADRAASQLAAIGAPPGGVPRRMAQHLAMGAAGAELLGELAGVPEFAADVVEAAQGVLAEMVAQLAERGARPGDRLLAAVAGSMASEPAAWPTREHYATAVAGASVMPREVYGWDLAGDGYYTGDVAVITTRLGDLARDAGINDVGVALRDLRKRDLLTVRDSKNLACLVRVAGKPKRAYVLAGVIPDENDEETGGPPDGNPRGGPEPAAPEPAPGGDQAAAAALDLLRAQFGATLLDESGAVEPAAVSTTAAVEPCARCTEPGAFCGVGSVADVELACVACGVPTPVRSRCGAPRTGICHGPERPGDRPTASPGVDDPGRAGSAPLGASRAAKARTTARDAAAADSRAALAAGEPVRLLRALETTHAPLRRVEGRMRKPYLRPELPGVMFAAHVVTGWAWSRPYSGPVAVLDRSGAWVAAASSVQVAHGGLEHTGELEFDGRPGLYELQRHPWLEDGLPDPLGNAEGETVWVPGPTVALLRDLVSEGRWADVTVLDSYTGDGCRLNKWTGYVNGLRSAAIKEYGRDSDQYASVKVAFGQAMSLMLGEYEDSVRRKWKCATQRPDWTQAIQAQAAATLWRWADDCRKVAPDHTPVALRNVDELVIPAPALEIVTSTPRPGGRAPLGIDPDGIKLGSFKVKAGEKWESRS